MMKTCDLPKNNTCCEILLRFKMILLTFQNWVENSISEMKRVNILKTSFINFTLISKISFTWFALLILEKDKNQSKLLLRLTLEPVFWIWVTIFCRISLDWPLIRFDFQNVNNKQKQTCQGREFSSFSLRADSPILIHKWSNRCKENG